MDNSTISSYDVVIKWPRPKQPFPRQKYTASDPFAYTQKIYFIPHDFKLELMTNSVPVVSLSRQVYGVCSMQSDAKSKEEKELMNDRNINKFLEGTYKAVCVALNWSLKTDVQLNSFQLQTIDSANTSSLRNDGVQYVT